MYEFRDGGLKIGQDLLLSSGSCSDVAEEVGKLLNDMGGCIQWCRCIDSEFGTPIAILSCMDGLLPGFSLEGLRHLFFYCWTFI